MILHDSITNFPYKCEDSSSCSPYYFTFLLGVYQLEVWGAQGGSISSQSGKGGYSKGSITIKSKTKAFIHIGGRGTYNTKIGLQKGGNNGGGNGFREADYGGGGGGGGTDIRLRHDSLFNRVIVAGGGGGEGIHNNAEKFQGGGGSTGKNGQISRPSDARNFKTTAGSQIASGEVSCNPNVGYLCIYGDTSGFGYGGSSPNISILWSSAGGGGGWFGGASGPCYGSSGSGGSGYVFKKDSNIVPNFKLSADDYLNDTSLLNGNSNIPKLDGTGNEKGHSGDGYARISLIKFFEYTPPTCKCSLYRKVIFSYILYSFLITK